MRENSFDTITEVYKGHYRLILHDTLKKGSRTTKDVVTNSCKKINAPPKKTVKTKKARLKRDALNV